MRAVVFALLLALPAGLASAGALDLGPPEGTPPPADQVQDLARDIGARLRCPVCQGSSINDSPADSAVNMVERTRELVADGYTEQQIRDYFSSKYGEWVLLDPPPSTNPWIWATPIGAGLVALGVVGWMARRRRDDEPDDDAPPPPSTPTDDAYTRRLLDEVDA